MNTQHIISTTDARKNLFKILEEVSSPNIVYTLTERGRAKAVIMSAQEFESWAETLDLLSQFKNISKDVSDARKDIRAGNVVTLDNLKKKYR